MNDRFITTVEEDPITKDLFLQLPTDLLNQMGWSEGTDLFWIDNHNGTFTLTNKNVNEKASLVPEDTDVGC